MASVTPGGRGGPRHRRSMGEINMVPFIDVMLVLLIIFMVSAPLVAPSVVDLPSVGRARQAPAHVIEVVVNADASLALRLDAGSAQPAQLDTLAQAVKALQGKPPARAADAVPVVIAADKSVRYEQVVKVMDTLQRAGVERVGLALKSAP